MSVLKLTASADAAKGIASSRIQRQADFGEDIRIMDFRFRRGSQGRDKESIRKAGSLPTVKRGRPLVLASLPTYVPAEERITMLEFRPNQSRFALIELLTAAPSQRFMERRPVRTGLNPFPQESESHVAR